MLCGAQKEDECLNCVCSIRFITKVDHPMNNYPNHFVVARSNRALPADSLVSACCRTSVELIRLFLPTVVRLWNVGCA